MTKRRKVNSLHWVISEGIDELGGKPAVAVILPHRSENWLYKATDPQPDPQYAAKLTYEDARAMTMAGARAFAEDLAALLGMALVPLEAGPSDAAQIMAKSAVLMAESGEAVMAIGAALADGVVTEAERENMRKQVVDVKRAATETLEALGGFGNG